ncbi:hypothetical protein OG871_39515 (plasmid) [Kitasatospora sp. NBC_00374]|uniref:hypothetical protein n=1 Tax=Kitasatospora sp. NBC_00374 TaxID=2975964 RepID=UPI002F912DDE
MDLIPKPGYTARLDQDQAKARDLPAEVRDRIAAAAESMLQAPTEETAGALFAELRAAGFDQ